ncbi:MAG TPA: hypothetical protein VEU77_04805 [Candidatus Acidoferrales bacterium]|nr:hypothetical protein [Candidatus Acidoferrales bacterium]
MTDQTVEIRLPPKRHVDLVLAVIAGALAVLVVLSARGAIVAHPGAPTSAPLVSPTERASLLPAVPPAPPKKEEHKGHG